MRGPLLKLCNKFHYPFDSQKFSLQIKHNVKETAHQNKDNSQLKAYCLDITPNSQENGCHLVSRDSFQIFQVKGLLCILKKYYMYSISRNKCIHKSIYTYSKLLMP